MASVVDPLTAEATRYARFTMKQSGFAITCPSPTANGPSGIGSYVVRISDQPFPRRPWPRHRCRMHG